MNIRLLEDIKNGKMKRAVIISETTSGDLYMETLTSHLDSLGLIEWGGLMIRETLLAAIQSRGTVKPKGPPVGGSGDINN